MSALRHIDENVLRTCLELFNGDDDEGVPQDVLHYVVGETEHLPADWGWAPDGFTPLLNVLREVIKDHNWQQASDAATAELRAGEVV